MQTQTTQAETNKKPIDCPICDGTGVIAYTSTAGELREATCLDCTDGKIQDPHMAARLKKDFGTLENAKATTSRYFSWREIAHKNAVSRRNKTGAGA